MSRRKKRDLSADDAALWASTTLSVDPLDGRVRGRAAVSPSSDLPPTKTEARPSLDTMPATNNPKTTWEKLEQHIAGASGGGNSVDPKPKIDGGPFDPKQARKIARGRVEIDGRIDLHGMRRDEARRALQGFLHRSQLQGARTVLVITGKGRTEDPSKPWYEAEGRGVLKREVPIWLRSPNLSPIVVGFTDASQKHGGSGALYVQVRKLGKR